MKSYVSEGTIAIRDEYQLTYAVCDLSYTLWEDGSFRYVFRPNYSVISLLDSSLFQGIPGLNLDLKKKEYVRENKEPVFISERVPSKRREGYEDYLKALGMPFMDPILYLIKTDEQYFGDPLFVMEKHEKILYAIEEANPYQNNSALTRAILEHLSLGDDLLMDGMVIDDSSRDIVFHALLSLYSRSRLAAKEKQQEGIEQAKARHAYKGRKKKPLNELKFRECVHEVEQGKMRPKEAADLLHISIDRYYREKKRLQKENDTLLQ